MGGSRFLRTAALSAWVVIFLFLSGGCTAKETIIAVATASPSAAPTGLVGAVDTAGALQSNMEADMVRVFHFLIQLDSVKETTISYRQAEAMLPLVRTSVEKGTLGEEEKLVIIKLLRPEQLLVYMRWAARKDPPLGGKPPSSEESPEMSGQEKRQWKEKWIRKAITEYSETLNPGEGKNPPTEQEKRGRSMKDDWTAEEKNVEQQLMDLLKSKPKE